MRRSNVGRRAVLGAALLGTAGLWMAGASSPASAQADSAVVAPIQRLIAGLLEVMKSGRSTPFGQRFDLLAPVVDATFDLSVILQNSVGLIWSSLPEDQKTALEDAFRRYTVASYVNSFDSFTGQRFEISPDTRAVGNGEQIVQTRIIPRSGDGHELDYVMRGIGSGWRVVDVLADGAVSRVAVQRSDFRQLLVRGGAPALLAQLQQKVIDLSGGVNG